MSETRVIDLDVVKALVRPPSEGVDLTKWAEDFVAVWRAHSYPDQNWIPPKRDAQ